MAVLIEAPALSSPSGEQYELAPGVYPDRKARDPRSLLLRLPLSISLNIATPIIHGE